MVKGTVMKRNFLIIFLCFLLSGIFMMQSSAVTVSASSGQASARKKTYESKKRKKVMKQFHKKLQKITKETDTPEVKLKKCFQWFSKCRYVQVSVKPTKNKRYNGWDITCASNMLKKKRGNCYYYSCAFAFFAREIGYRAKIVVGTALNSGKSARNEHCWVEINGKIYDPERKCVSWYDKKISFYAMSYKSQYKYKALFKI